MPFSIVVPIHNEEKLLPQTLPSITALKPDQIILLFDRCTDNSQKTARNIIARNRMLGITLFIKIDKTYDYKLPFAFLRVLGCGFSIYDNVLITAADLILDPKIKDYISLMNKYGLITFEHKDYPVNWRNLIKRLLTRILPFNWLGGTRIFNRMLMYDHEDLDDLKKRDWEDTHLADAIRPHMKSLYVLSDTIHLRPRESPEHHTRLGRIYREAGRSFTLTLLCALCMWRLNMLKGYIRGGDL